MRTFKQLFVAILRLALAACAFAGTYEAWTLEVPNKFVYFTFQTNIILGIVMAWAGLATLLRGIQPPAWLKGCLTLYIGITGLVAWLVLAPSDPKTTPLVFGLMTTTFAHIIVPIGAVVDFILFDNHRRMKWHYSLTWLLYFPVYLTFVLVRAAIWPHSGPADDGSPYPYPFVDVPNLGWGSFSINVVVYLLAFLVLGLIIVGIDKVLPSKALISTATGRK